MPHQLTAANAVPSAYRRDTPDIDLRWQTLEMCEEYRGSETGPYRARGFWTADDGNEQSGSTRQGEDIEFSMKKLTKSSSDNRTSDMHATPILQYLKQHVQQLDSEIATAMRIPLAQVRVSLIDLSARGEISSCSVTRFNGGKPVEGMLYRIAGFIPPSAPGPKPGGSGVTGG
ncbi:MAG: hypothetical protein WC073_03695 [Sterolibacterium sp.]